MRKKVNGKDIKKTNEALKPSSLFLPLYLFVFISLSSPQFAPPTSFAFQRIQSRGEKERKKVNGKDVKKVREGVNDQPAPPKPIQRGCKNERKKK